jgi:glutamate N-acetyltransferase/amino-acid N-acetyltransferase
MRGDIMGDDHYRVPGFKASAVAAGLKKDGSKDVALIFSEKISAAAGVFTRNKVKAAPVILSQDHIESGKARAIIVNAGNANACTGEKGMADARAMAALAADELGIDANEVIVGSTGVIGKPLDMGLIERAVTELVKNLSFEGIPEAAQAIMTTDTFTKLSRYEGIAGGQRYRIVGMAKGAGMIMPDMATMLGFLLTDIHVKSADLHRAVLSSVEKTFNRVTVDGDTSTNDMVIVLANGLASNSDLREEDVRGFEGGLRKVMGELARMIARDGEGASKLIEIRVRGAASPTDALNAARTVANSPLVKTAFYGRDANWGRIMAALGRSGIRMEPDRVDLWIDDIQIVSGGLGSGEEAEKRAEQRMANEAVTLKIDLHQGGSEEEVMTCDFTHDYVSINADYRT